MPIRRPLSAIAVTDAAELMNRGFKGYLVSVRTDPGAFARMIEVDGIDADASWVVSDDGEDVGIALIARRGSSSRLATMAIVSTARGRGIGRWTLDALLEDAVGRGDESMRLECIAQNKAAFDLYLSAGFEVRRRLLGHQATSAAILATRASARAPELEAITVRSVGAAMTAAPSIDLPWQIDAARMLAYRGPAAAFRLGPAHAVIDRRNESISVLTVWVAPAKRRQGAASELIAALAARFPDSRWMAPPLVPEGHVGDFFETLGFEPLELHQVEMRRSFRSP